LLAPLVSSAFGALNTFAACYILRLAAKKSVSDLLRNLS
jgi:hypothetical protein